MQNDFAQLREQHAREVSAEWLDGLRKRHATMTPEEFTLAAVNAAFVEAPSDNEDEEVDDSADDDSDEEESEDEDESEEEA